MTELLQQINSAAGCQQTAILTDNGCSLSTKIKWRFEKQFLP